MTFADFETVTVETEGVVLDMILWRRFRRPVPGLIEALLALPENWRLGRLPVELPIGTTVVIPIPAERTTNRITVVDLWS